MNNNLTGISMDEEYNKVNDAWCSSKLTKISITKNNKENILIIIDNHSIIYDLLKYIQKLIPYLT